MWGMFIHSLQLFLRGRLFREPRVVFRQWSIGFAAAAAAVIVLARLGVPPGIAVAVAALAVGVLQPILFKNLKYA